MHVDLCVCARRHLGLRRIITGLRCPDNEHPALIMGILLLIGSTQFLDVVKLPYKPLRALLLCSGLFGISLAGLSPGPLSLSTFALGRRAHP